MPKRLALIAALVLIALHGRAAALELAPHKDRLFAYPAEIARSDGGAHVTVDYRELRDINQRDEVPERRVKADYVSLGVRRAQRDLVLKTDAGELRHVAVGKADGARIIAVYIHGQGGSRKQGADDFTFGGNFNRLKNLMAKNDGLYLSPDFSGFDRNGAAQVAALIAHYRARSPGAPVFLACGSMGGAICYALASDPDAAAMIAGYLLLGSFPDESFLSSPAHARRTPVFFGHGSRDRVFPVEGQEALFRRLRQDGSYPARFVRFEGGTHGTPIRMVDWRAELNRMLAAAP